MKPLVSVIMPVFQASAYVRAALESVLGQTYRPLEIICVDDGSTDGSREILESFRPEIRIVSHDRNKGIAAARNTGLGESKGEFISFLDADDLWEPQKLSLQMDFAATHPDTAIVFSFMRCFLSPDLPEPVRAKRFCPPQPLAGHAPGTALVRRDVFDDIGGFDSKWRIGEFIDWMNRARAAGYHHETISETLLLRRIHGANTVSRGQDVRSDYLRIVKEALDRKRQGA